MTKSIEYYLCSNPTEDGLIRKLQETWGDSFEYLGDNERLWMIARLAHEIWNKTEFENESIKESCEVAPRRAVTQLSYHDCLGLLEYLIHQVRYDY